MGTLFEENCASSAVSRFTLLRFSGKFRYNTVDVCAKNDVTLVAIFQKLRILYLRSNVSFRLYLFNLCDKFGQNLSTIKGTLLEEQCACSVAARLPLFGFSWIFAPKNTNACAANNAHLVAIGR